MLTRLKTNNNSAEHKLYWQAFDSVYRQVEDQVYRQVLDRVFGYIYEVINDYIDNRVWWAVYLPVFEQLKERTEKEIPVPGKPLIWNHLNYAEIYQEIYGFRPKRKSQRRYGM